MTEDESGHALDLKDIFVILPQNVGIDMPTLTTPKGAQSAPRGAYCSH